MKKFRPSTEHAPCVLIISSEYIELTIFTEKLYFRFELRVSFQRALQLSDLFLGCRQSIEKLTCTAPRHHLLDKSQIVKRIRKRPCVNLLSPSSPKLHHHHYHHHYHHHQKFTITTVIITITITTIIIITKNSPAPTSCIYSKHILSRAQ